MTTSPRDNSLGIVQRAADTVAAAIEDVAVDHGCLDILAEKRLDGADVISGLEKPHPTACRYYD